MSPTLILLLSATVSMYHCQDYTNNGQWMPQNGDSSPRAFQNGQNSTPSIRAANDIELVNGNCVYSNGQLNDNGVTRNLTESEKQQLQQYLQDIDSYTQNLDKNIFQILGDFFSFGAPQNSNYDQNSDSNGQNQEGGNGVQRQQNENIRSSHNRPPIVAAFPSAPCFCQSC